MRSAPETLVIVAQSARALVQSAVRGGLRTIAVDAFGDLDTRAVSAEYRRLPWPFDGALPLPDCQRAGVGLVYGGGLECRPDALQPWHEAARLWGNPPQTLALASEPRVFFALLDRLGIAYPEVCHNPPASEGDWLVKRARSSGGTHIGVWQHGANAAGDAYFQRRIPGDAVSILFLAAGREIHVIGYNTLYQSSGGFAYAGAVNRADLDSGQRAALCRAARLLSAELGLVGLNCIDAIVTPEGIRVLELNPRPSASFELYDADYRNGLLFWHLRACRGELPGKTDFEPSAVTRRRVIFAEDGVTVPAAFAWPDWAHDRPGAGLRIRAREPICTIAATGDDPEQVAADIAARERILEQKLSTRSEAA